MKFTELLDPKILRIEAYDASHFRINGRRFAHGVLLLPDVDVQPWQPARTDALDSKDLEILFDTCPQVLLIGTGADQPLPPPALLAASAARGIGLEWMRTGAACRTYNLLAGEGRRVAAGLLLDGT
jgi:uncharacterized protein